MILYDSVRIIRNSRPDRKKIIIELRYNFPGWKRNEMEGVANVNKQSKRLTKKLFIFIM